MDDGGTFAKAACPGAIQLPASGDCANRMFRSCGSRSIATQTAALGSASGKPPQTESDRAQACFRGSLGIVGRVADAADIVVRHTVQLLQGDFEPVGVRLRPVSSELVATLTRPAIPKISV